MHAVRADRICRTSSKACPVNRIQNFSNYNLSLTCRRYYSLPEVPDLLVSSKAARYSRGGRGWSSEAALGNGESVIFDSLITRSFKVGSGVVEVSLTFRISVTEEHFGGRS